MNNKLILIICAFSALWLTACNSSDNTQKQSVGNDWVVETPVPNTPNPAPTGAPPAGPTTPTESLYTGPPEVAKYVAKFVADAKAQGRDVEPEMHNPKLEIRIASLDSYGSSTIGLCETGSNRRRVTFDPDFWNSVNETQRELLAHHEFGHCVLYRGHRSETLSSGKYASIMYPIIMSTSTYTNDYNYYQEELFTYAALSLEEDTANRNTTHVCN